MGEVVGRSPAMMTGYHGRKDASAAAEWFDAEGNRYIRHGDVGRFDADGFLTLLDRKKDLIISGGFNIYPTDLEAVLAQHPAVADCSVIGVPSEAWGETPLGFYVRRADATESHEEILAWTNAQLGKTQRLSALHAIDELPRNAIGKVLKARTARPAGGGRHMTPIADILAATTAVEGGFRAMIPADWLQGRTTYWRPVERARAPRRAALRAGPAAARSAQDRLYRPARGRGDRHRDEASPRPAPPPSSRRTSIRTPGSATARLSSSCRTSHRRSISRAASSAPVGRPRPMRRSTPDLTGSSPATSTSST